jgi:hypothetical protein
LLEGELELAREETTAYRAAFEGPKWELKAAQDAADHVHTQAMGVRLGPIFIPVKW